MKAVDDVLIQFGFYPVLLNIIDGYDGDSHTDAHFKDRFSSNVVRPLEQLMRDDFQLDLTPKQLLAITIIVHSRRSILLCGSNTFEQGPVTYYARIHGNILTVANYYRDIYIPPLKDPKMECYPEERILVCYAPRAAISGFPGFRVFDWN